MANLFIPSTVSSGRSTMIKIAWFEAGLLNRYSIDQFIQVLKDFNFDAVHINPFKLDANGLQTEIVDGAYQLCDAVDLYAEQHPGFLKFLVVGGGETYLNYGLVEDFKARNYVMTVSDSGQNYQATKQLLQYLKNLGVQTCLSHGYWEGAKQLIADGLVDYSMSWFYPYFSNTDNFDTLAYQFSVMKGWSEGKAKFLPSMQVFGLYNPVTNVTWRFPTTDEVQRELNFLIDLNPYGIEWFEPFSGQSQRGETFDGFLAHPDVWDIVKNPQKRDLPFEIPPAVIIIAVPVIIYVGKKLYDWIKGKE
jgi:hypothetical protein